MNSERSATLQWEVFADASALAAAAADAIARAAVAAVQARGRFTIALSGGSTPRAVYQRLGTQRELPWSQIELCFGDERAVPPEHSDSNARMVRESLLLGGLARPERLHRILGELPPLQAATRYESSLRALFADVELPRFDLILLGLGPDGHTASLFPGSDALDERTRWVAANWVPQLNTSRITLTFPVLNAAAQVLFLVSGHDKAAALRSTFAPEGDPKVTPARGVRPRDGSLLYFVDQAAAAALDDSR